jgi:hypothetical protein
MGLGEWGRKTSRKNLTLQINGSIQGKSSIWIKSKFVAFDFVFLL